MKKYDYICQACNKPFQHRKPDKIYCSVLCYRMTAAQRKAVAFKVINCETCNKEIEIRKTDKEIRRFCSRPCIDKSELRIRIPVICGWCSEEFERIPSRLGKENVFCSEYCSIEFKHNNKKELITKNCLNCKDEFISRENAERKFCSKSCGKSEEFHHYYGKSSPMKGKKAWNNGLTTETDSRLAELGKKISIISKQQFTDGTRSNEGENNPNYGITRDQRPAEQLANYSKAAIKRIKEGHMIRIRGFHESLKINQTVPYRSSFELRVMKCLEKDPDVLNWEYEPFSIPYDEGKRRYLPDFMIYYKNNKNKLIEVKCDYTESTGNYDQKKIVAIKWCNQNNSEFETWKEPEIIQYEQRLNYLESKL